MNRTRFASALAMAALAAILLPSFLNAQITFERTYGGEANDEGNSACQTSDGGYVITGATYSRDSLNPDIYVVRTDARGDTLWTKTYGDTDNDRGQFVQQTADGGYIIAGSTRSFGAGREDVYLIKLDPSGDTLWTRTFGGSNIDLAISALQTFDGGYVVTGFTYSYGEGSSDVYLIKTDANGDSTWTRTFGGGSYDWGNSVRQTADSGYIIVGGTSSYGAGWEDVYLIRTDPHGIAQWSHTIGGTENDVGNSIQQTDDGGYIIAGMTETYGAGDCDVYLLKTDANGDTVWTRTFGGPGWDWGWSVQQAPDGGYVVAGHTISFGAGSNDVYLVRTNSQGDSMWTRTYGGAGDDQGHSVQQTGDGGYAITGWTGSFGAGREDVYLIKTDSLGSVAVAEPKPSPTRAPAFSLTCEPNPFRTRTAISLQLTADSPAELAIFDVGGRRMRTFTLNRTSFAIWTGDDDFGRPVSPGTYFCLLKTASGRTATRRVVLLP